MNDNFTVGMSGWFDPTYINDKLRWSTCECRRFGQPPFFYMTINLNDVVGTSPRRDMCLPRTLPTYSIYLYGGWGFGLSVCLDPTLHIPPDTPYHS